MGLAIVQDLVRPCRGTLHASHSESLDGARFTVRFPGQRQGSATSAGLLVSSGESPEQRVTLAACMPLSRAFVN